MNITAETAPEGLGVPTGTQTDMSKECQEIFEPKQDTEPDSGQLSKSPNRSVSLCVSSDMTLDPDWSTAKSTLHGRSDLLVVRIWIEGFRKNVLKFIVSHRKS